MSRVLELSPRMHAQRMMSDALRDIAILEQLLDKNCTCHSHQGRHEVHLSKVRLEQNYQRLLVILEEHSELRNHGRFVNELFLFHVEEMLRQHEMLTDAHLGHWRKETYSDSSEDVLPA